MLTAAYFYQMQSKMGPLATYIDNWTIIHVFVSHVQFCISLLDDLGYLDLQMKYALVIHVFLFFSLLTWQHNEASKKLFQLLLFLFVVSLLLPINYLMLVVGKYLVFNIARKNPCDANA